MPVNVATVESMLKVTVLFVIAESSPVPPVNVNVSVNNATASVPVSPAMFKLVAKDAVPAAVNCPCALTVNVGIDVEDCVV